jgi:hypothetical protein
MSEDKRSKVEMIIGRVSERQGVSWTEARTMVHKYVCEGKCGWYRTRSGEAGFDRLDLARQQKKLIEEIVNEAMKDLAIDEAKWRIHEILCPGHPRPRPKRSPK